VCAGETFPQTPFMTGIVRETILAMATFHLHGQVIKRSDGRSVVNAAAYRAGEALYDRRLGKEFDYTRKADVEESIILAPTHAATWMFDRELLWNAVEEAERRLNSQLAREFDIAIPIELARKNPKAAKKAVLRWATEMFLSQGLVIDISFHDMKKRNPHAHVMVTMRRVHPHAAEFDVGSRHAFETHKAKELNDRGYMDFWRECWAEIANEALAAEGIDARIDHRTLIEQGITDREPGIHVGPNANAMAARGIGADRWVQNAIIWFVNEESYWEENRARLAWAEEIEAGRERQAQVIEPAQGQVGGETQTPLAPEATQASPMAAEPPLRMTERQSTRAWFISEEAYWLDNRAYLAWAEEEERRRDRDEAERVAAEEKELEQARAIVARSDELRRLSDEFVIAADKALARARDRLGSALQAFEKATLSFIDELQRRMTSIAEVAVRLDHADPGTQAEPDERDPPTSPNVESAGDLAMQVEDRGTDGPEPAEAIYALSDNNDSLAHDLANYLDRASVLEKMPVRRGPDGWHLETSVLSPYYQQVAAKIGDHRLLRSKIDDMKSGYERAVFDRLFGPEQVLERADGGIRIIRGKMSSALEAHLLNMLRHDPHVWANAEAAIDRWTSVAVNTPVSSSMQQSAVPASAAQPGRTWYDQMLQNSGRGGNGR
jgi:MobA/MobL family